MKDIQSRKDTRRIDIRKVGVKDISYPVTVLDKARKEQQTVASVNMYVNLPHQFKGTHMSRFVEILNNFHGKFTLKTLHLILQEMKERLDARAAHIEIAFPYFFQSSGAEDSFKSSKYDCLVHGSLLESLDMIVEVKVPVALHLTDIEHEASSTAHWGTVQVAVHLNHFMWLEDLIEMIEKAVLPIDTVERLCHRINGKLTEKSDFSWYRIIVEQVGSGFVTSASIEGP